MADILRRRHALGGDRRHGEDGSLAELFHENTKLHRAMAAPADPADGYGVRDMDAMARAYKRYRYHPRVALPPVPADLGGPAFPALVAARRTRRDFAAEPVDLAELSAILRWSYGVTGELDIVGGGRQPVRAAPSAGALYPAEIYLAVRAVRGLEAGLYHYEVPDHALALLRRGNPADLVHDVCCGQEPARQAAVVVLLSGVIERTRRKYGERGYRYVLLDIGHLGENLYLACTALDLAIVPTCGFLDDEAADLIGIDGCEEAVFYVAFVGRPGGR